MVVQTHPEADPPLVSVIIPGRGRVELTMTCIQALVEAVQHAPETVEVIYVDDASGDETAAILARRSPFLRIRRRLAPGGFACAVNEGLQLARGAIVLLLNSDVVVAPDFFAPLVRPFAYRSVFAVSANSRVGSHGDRYESVSRGIFADGLLRVEQPALSDPEAVPERISTNFHASGGFSAFDRSKLLELGGFPVAYAPFYWEDVEVSWRAWRRGWLTLVEPTSFVRHLGHATIDSLHSALHRRFVYERNCLSFFWRNVRDPDMFSNHLECLLDSRNKQGCWGLQGLGMRCHFVGQLLKETLSRVPSDPALLSDQEILRRSAGCSWEP